MGGQEENSMTYEDDLKKLHSDTAEECASFSELIREILMLNDSELSNFGSKTKEEAIFKAAKSHKEAVEKLSKTYLKKHPD